MNMGFLKVYALKGGWREWIKAQFPTETKGSLEHVCVRCHTNVTPRIVSDWQLSKHSQNEVTCSVCHGDQHMSEEDLAKVVIPTPRTCTMCHEIQGEQFKAGKHAAAWAAMKVMPIALMEGMKGCEEGHKIGLKAEAEIRELKKNGAGSGVASCDACHTRHLFSVQEARQPQACQTCHMGFDHPP